MRRIAGLAAVAALAFAPAAAVAHKGKSQGARVFKGTIVLVGADGAYTNGKFGKAQLVDNKRRDKLQVQAKHLAPNTLYQFQLVEGRCAQGAAGPTPVAGFRVTKALKTNRKGNGTGKARSRTFTARTGASYAVFIYKTAPGGGNGDLIACAQLRGKKEHKAKQHGKSHEKSHKQHGKSGEQHGNGHDERHGHDDGQGRRR